ncbi:glycosyltransferase [bacterium]|nr:glycosyltransferase [bacterium]
MVEISITVPVYNVEKYLPRCLNSLVNQTFKLDYEIICVDDGSTDNSGKILDDFAQKYPKIKVIYQENAGLSEARNTALKYVTGKYTMFVDSDDFIAPNALEDLYNYAQKHNSDVVIFDFFRGTCDEKNVTELHFKNIIEKYGDNSFNIDTAEPFVYRFVPVATWTKFYLTDLVKNIKFEKDLNNQDVPHWAEVYTKAKRVNYLPISYYYYSKQREGAITQIKGKKVFDKFKAFSLVEKILKNAGYFEKYKNIHYAHLTSNLVSILRKIKPELREEFVEAIKNYHMDINYDELVNEDFYHFEKVNMMLIKFVRENDFNTIDNLLKEKHFWS